MKPNMIVPVGTNAFPAPQGHISVGSVATDVYSVAQSTTTYTGPSSSLSDGTRDSQFHRNIGQAATAGNEYKIEVGVPEVDKSEENNRVEELGKQIMMVRICIVALVFALVGVIVSFFVF